jgi:hypothetical protein
MMKGAPFFLTVLGVFSLVCAVVSLLVPSPTPPGAAALERTEAKLELAQPGPVMIPGRRGSTTLGNTPGAWVFIVDVAGAKHRFAIDAPDEPRLRRLERLERSTPVVALIHGGEIWQLENGVGEVLVHYDERAAVALLSKGQGHAALAWFAGVGLGLVALGRGFARLAR